MYLVDVYLKSWNVILGMRQNFDASLEGQPGDTPRFRTVCSFDLEPQAEYTYYHFKPHEKVAGWKRGRGIKLNPGGR